MRMLPSFDPRAALKRTGYETAALAIRLAGYAGILLLLSVAALTLWEQLPETVAQARQVAIAAGWASDPPMLRGSL